MVNPYILMQKVDWGTDWIYLLFVIGISVLSWLGNLVKKRREEGQAGEILHPEEVTDVDVEEVFDDEPEPPRQPQRPVAPSTPFRPVSPPPLAQPVALPATPPRPIPPPQAPSQDLPGPAVVLPRLAQIGSKPTQTAAEAVLHPKPAAKPLLPVAAELNVRDRRALQRAIIMAEILDRPIALRPGRTADSF